MTNPWKVKSAALDEAYVYFDRTIRPLAKLPDGKVDPAAKGLEDNDVDAFRHAYVSGVFTQTYGEDTADLFGRINELDPASMYSNSRNPKAKNMDLWNNGVGRKLGKKAKNREELLKNVHEALRKGELITDPNDTRVYKGAKRTPGSASKPVIAIGKSKSGRNEWFLDTLKKEVFGRNEFIVRIRAGDYPGYTVKTVNGQPTPVSNPDGRKTNNLS